MQVLMVSCTTLAQSETTTTLLTGCRTGGENSISMSWFFSLVAYGYFFAGLESCSCKTFLRYVRFFQIDP